MEIQSLTQIRIVIAHIGFHIFNDGLISAGILISFKYVHRKVASSNTSRLEAHDGYFRLLNMNGIFDPYVL